MISQEKKKFQMNKFKMKQSKFRNQTTKKKNKRKLISLFIKLHKLRFNNMLNKIFKNLKTFKNLNQLKNQITINLLLIFVAFLGISKNQKNRKSFIGENRNFLIQINYKI